MFVGPSRQPRVRKIAILRTASGTYLPPPGAPTNKVEHGFAGVDSGSKGGAARRKATESPIN
jgi:hypothetical protein